MAISFQNKRVFPDGEYPHTIDVYNAVIHPALKNKFFEDKKLLDEERKKADIMSNYFTMIKQAIVEGDNKQAAVFPPEFINYLIQRQIFGTNPRVRKYSGVAFESDLVTIINAVATQRTYNSQPSRQGRRSYVANRVGKYQARPDLELVINEDLDNEMRNLISNTEIAVVKHKSVSNVTHRLVKRQGLIDVRVPKSAVTLTYDINMPHLDEFWWALDGAQFSAKNYKLETILDKNISLGSASNLRKIGSALNFVLDNPGSVDVQRIFFASMQNNTQEELVNQHLRHLTAIYELAGAGQVYYKKGKKGRGEQQADFGGIANYLIVNVNSDNKPVRVFSIRALIQDFVLGTQNNYKASIAISGKETKLQWNPDNR